MNATAACNRFRKIRQDEKKNEIKPPTENPSVPLVYMDMAYYAKDMNLWNDITTTLNMTLVVQLTKKFQEQTLGKKFYEFQDIISKNDDEPVITCPNNDIYNELLSRSLQVEKELFPKYYNSHGEKEILQHYNKLKYTKMCHVHANIVLQYSKEWKNFYIDLNRKYTIKNNNNKAVRMQSNDKSLPFSSSIDDEN